MRAALVASESAGIIAHAAYNGRENHSKTKTPRFAVGRVAHTFALFANVWVCAPPHLLLLLELHRRVPDSFAHFANEWAFDLGKAVDGRTLDFQRPLLGLHPHSSRLPIKGRE